MKAIFTTCSILLAFLLMFASYDQQVSAHKYVHIKVWRGPSHGHKKHKFAPWGYKAKLPADDYKHHG